MSIMVAKRKINNDLMDDILYGGQKKSGCKKKLRKCCTKSQLEATGKKKVKRCCCVPGGAKGTRGTGYELPRGDPWETPYESPRGSPPPYESPRGSPRGDDTSRTRSEGASIRDIGAAMMGGISTSIGSSVTGVPGVR